VTARPLQRAGSLPVLAWLVSFGAALVVGVTWMGLPVSRLWLIVVYLVISSTVSMVLGLAVYRLTEARRRSLRMKLLLAHALGTGIIIANIYAAAELMFISAHDFGFLLLLLAASAAFSVTFGAAVADRMTAAVEQLALGAQEVARGNFRARVDVSTNDELADLAGSFNEMVSHVNESSELREQAESARRDLVAAVSHDLRTPLTAIRAMLEALADGVVDDPETVARYHSTMRSQVVHLNRLIDDLFELSQMDAGGERYVLQSADLAALVGEAVESFAMRAAARGVEVRLLADGSAVLPIEPARIARVLNNLVDNALRHSPSGTAIEVQLSRPPGEYHVSVRDHGEGLSAVDLPRVFDRFYRGEKSRSREFGGAGLGLAIARGIVEAHGGRIWAANASDGGAVFTFALPRTPQG
jgi:two-component system sensor histidine kinase SaeS